MRSEGLNRCLLPALPLMAAAPALSQSCLPYWADAGRGLPTYPLSLALVDDGHGPGLFASDEENDDLVYRWDGTSWTNIAATLPTALFMSYRVSVLDDGAGPAAWVVGNMQDGVSTTFFGRRWNGSAWVQPPQGLVPPDGSALPYTSCDLGDGIHIYGRLRQVGTSHYKIGKWTGTEWVAISGETFTGSFHLVAFPGASGPRLYALGGFATIGGVQTNGFARWLGGTDWEQVPSNHQTISDPRDVAVVDFGSGPAIYAYCDLLRIDNNPDPIVGIGKWNGQSWVNLGGPGMGQGQGYARTRMKVFDDGTGGGPAIYVTGGFTNWGGIEAHGIVRWDGQNWSSIVRGIKFGGEVYDMAGGIGPHGRALYIGGTVIEAGAGTVRYVAELNGCPNCYANCDRSTTPPVLNVRDFLCFLNMFTAGDAYANCDQSTVLPGLDVSDFACFLNKFAAGCP